MTPLLSVDIRRSSYGVVDVLHNVSVEIGRKEIVAVLGGNGAGKTTLLRTISGVMVRATARISLDGKDLSKLSAAARVGAGIGHVPEGRRVFGDLTVQENLDVAGHARHASRTDSEEILERIFALFPVLADRRDQRATSLSGGEQQMLAVSRALMLRPKVLMVDEASLGLAPLKIREMFAALAGLRDQDLSVLLVEQNAKASLAIADRAYVLSRGTVAVTGTAEELLADERLTSTYLGITGDTTAGREPVQT